MAFPMVALSITFLGLIGLIFRTVEELDPFHENNRMTQWEKNTAIF